MRLSTALLLLIPATATARRLFDASKMDHIIESEANRMTVNGIAIESADEIEAEVKAIVALYEDAGEGTEETNDDFNFDTEDMELFGSKSGKE